MSKKIQWTEEYIRNGANERGGKLVEIISGKGACSRCKFECSKGHQWENSAKYAFDNQTFCRVCYKKSYRKGVFPKNPTLSIQTCHEEAAKRGGKCLDTTYKNKRTIMNWECKDGHRFQLRLGAVRNNGRWCKICSDNKKRHDISVAQELARKNGGECLSTEYVNLDTPLRWRCKNGHEWEVAMLGIKCLGQWCRMCVLRDRRDRALDKLDDFIVKRGGQRISKRTEDMYDVRAELIPIKVKCGKGHIFKRNLQSLYNGSWCPKCWLKSETACRDIFEELFGEPFPKKRLKEMEYLELDGYNANFGIAFEYNGQQHDKYIPHFHRNGVEDFYDQQIRDEKKRKLCDENGIALVTIPYEYDYTNLELLEEYITQELEHLGF